MPKVGFADAILLSLVSNHSPIPKYNSLVHQATFGLLVGGNVGYYFLRARSKRIEKEGGGE